MQVFLEWPDLIKYPSNTFSQTIARKSLLMLRAAKLKLQRTCFSVVCPRLDEKDGIQICQPRNERSHCFNSQ